MRKTFWFVAFLLFVLTFFDFASADPSGIVSDDLPAPGNVLFNSDFENGTSPWVFYTNGSGTFKNDAPGAESSYAGHITIIQPGANVQLHQAGLVLEPNTRYMLSFKAYSNIGHDLSVSLQKHGSPYTSYGLSNQQFNLASSWGEYSAVFTTANFSGTVNDGRLMFWLAPYATNGDQYFIDDVVLTKVVTSALSNPGFENGTSPWVFYTNGSGTFKNDAPGAESSYAGHITIIQPGANVQLHQAGLVLEPNTLYMLSFKAYSNTGHDLSVSLQKHGSPYTSYGLSNQQFNLTSSWGEYSAVFTTTNFSGTVNDGRLMFWLAPYATNGDQYFIDDVVLTKVVTSATPPSISTQPANKTVSVGQTATFNVVATGTAPLSYQWQKSGLNIPGATSASYTTPATTLADNGAVFRCKVTNSAGSVTSNTATLTVISAITSILSNPGFENGTSPWVFYTNGSGTFKNDAPGAESSYAGHITIIQPGANVQLHQAGLVLEPNTLYMLSFKAYSNTGRDLSVSLQKHGSPYTSYGLLNRLFNLTSSWGEYSAVFTTANFSGTVNDGRLMFWLAPYATNGDQYFIDDVVLTKVVTSATPPSISTQPANKTVSVGQTATFNVVATGTAPLSYQWQKNGVNITAATSASYTTPAVVLSDNGAVFRCIVSNSAGNATSNSATLTVTSTPPPPQNNQLLLINRTFVHSTSYSAALLGETPSPGNSNCIYVIGIAYSPGEAGNDVCNHEAFKFFQLPPSTPSGWTSPVNYAQGTLYQRIEVIEKPTTTPVRYAICLFQDQIVAERHACGDLGRMAFTAPGTYYSSQSMPTLYQYSTAVDWTRRPHVIMLHMTDAYGHQPDSYPGFMDLWFGTPNWSLYYPMKLRYTAIIVPPGGGQPVWP